MIACPALRNSQVTDRKAEATPVFTSLQYCCFAYCFCLSCSSFNQHTSRFWSVKLLALGADHATIPHMKGDCHSFHMRYSSMICCKRLQSDRPCKLLSVCPLYVNHLHFWLQNMRNTNFVHVISAKNTALAAEHAEECAA